jgi:RNA polymerase sigma factor (sigma-70 family)
MPELNDHELLADFARSESETAFAELVARHVNLVYSAAQRFSGSPQCAEEITQAVFIILARKAKNISGKIILSGWLYQTARLTAANFMKGEIRRQQREQEAYMQSTLNDTDAAAWQQIAPLLDDAMGYLGETDRTAVVLRFFENKTAAEVAAALKLTEAAAHKRVNRALEKLRKIFSKRGVTFSVTLIAGVVAANSVQAAPASLAATVTAAVANGASISATLTTLVKGTMKTMTWIKLKLAVVAGVSVLFTGGIALVAVSQIGGGGQLSPQQIAKRSQTAYAALSSYSDSGKIIDTIGTQEIPTTFNIRLQRPNLYHIDWTQTTAYFTNGGSVWSAGSGDFMAMNNSGYAARPEKYRDMQSVLAAATGVSGGASSTIPGTFYQQNWGDTLKVAASGRNQFTMQNDESISGVDCYVMSSSMDSSSLPQQGQLPNHGGKIGKRTTTLWIGKEDYLIHQVETIVEGASFKLPVMSDAQIQKMIQLQNKPVTSEAIAAKRAQLAAANQQAQSMMASGKIISIQMHDHIVLNPKFSPADFAR